MEIVNVVINEPSNSGSERVSEEFSKEILPPKSKEVQEIIKQEPATLSTPGTPSVVEDSVDISTSSDSESHKEK